MGKYRYIKIALILIPIVILGFFGYKYIIPSGVLRIDYDFCSEDPFISSLSPMGRVLKIENKKGYCEQKMVIDPVYFDVRLPQSFREVKVKVWYQKNDDVSLKIGSRFNPNEWSWGLKEVEFLDNDGDWKVGYVYLKLDYVTMENKRIRFLVSSPGLDVSGEEIKFKRIEMEFIKDKLSLNNLGSRIWSFIKN